MLQKNKIYLILTDASSYPSLKERWRKTCAKLKTPYYDTQKKVLTYLPLKRGI